MEKFLNRITSQSRNDKLWVPDRETPGDSTVHSRFLDLIVSLKVCVNPIRNQEHEHVEYCCWVG